MVKHAWDLWASGEQYDVVGPRRDIFHHRRRRRATLWELSASFDVRGQEIAVQKDLTLIARANTHQI